MSDSEPAEALSVPKWEDILGNGKLVKLTLDKTDKERPQRGSLVTLVYDVYTFEDPDTDYFDYVTDHESILHKDETIFIGVGDANLQALDLGVMLMNEGEKAVIKCLNPQLAYAMEPPEYQPLEIPPDSNVFIVVSLVKDHGPPVPWVQKSQAERVNYAMKKVDKGNAFCKAKQFPSAINCYSSALRVVGFNAEIDDMDEDQDYDPEPENEVRVKAYSGLSAAHFNSSSFDIALKNCDEALNIDPYLVKIIFRRGRCLMQLQRMFEAKDSILAARTLVSEKPNDFDPEFIKFMDSELARVKTAINKDSKRESELFKKMLDVKPLPPKTPWQNLMDLIVAYQIPLLCIAAALFFLSILLKLLM